MVSFSAEVLADSMAPRAWEGSPGRWGNGPDRGQVPGGKSCIPWCSTVCVQLGTALQDPKPRKDLSYQVPKIRNLG